MRTYMSTKIKQKKYINLLNHFGCYEYPARLGGSNALVLYEQQRAGQGMWTSGQCNCMAACNRAIITTRATTKQQKFIKLSNFIDPQITCR